jgi:plasmid stability protein
MPVNLSIKKVPDQLYERLRERARRNHRSLQGELLAILESALAPQGRSLEDLHRRVQELGLRTGDEATQWLREERDAR